MHRFQQKLHIAPVNFSLLGQRHRTRGSVQQHHPKLLLKRRDLLTDGGLFHPALAGCRGKGSRFYHAQESGNGVELIIHLMILLISAISFTGYA